MVPTRSALRDLNFSSPKTTRNLRVRGGYYLPQLTIENALALQNANIYSEENDRRADAYQSIPSSGIGLTCNRTLSPGVERWIYRFRKVMLSSNSMTLRALNRRFKAKLPRDIRVDQIQSTGLFSSYALYLGQRCRIAPNDLQLRKMLLLRGIGHRCLVFRRLPVIWPGWSRLIPTHLHFSRWLRLTRPVPVRTQVAIAGVVSELPILVQ